MPTYQYACTECGHAFEQVQSFSDDALTHCPVCDGRLRKVFNAVGVVFKGSGFYRTDSRADSRAAAGSSSGSAKSGSGTSSSSDAKGSTSEKSTTTSDSKAGSSSSPSGSGSSGTKGSTGSSD
jgi:putative FmdB family regulatory protein